MSYYRIPFLFLLVFAISCGGDPGDGGEPLGGELRGHVYVGASPVQGAIIVAYRVDDTGRVASVAESEPTDDTGAFVIEIPDTYEGELELEALGAAATYTESASGATASFGSQTKLRMPLVRWTSAAQSNLDYHYERGEKRDGLVVNLWTELAVAYQEALVRSGAADSFAAGRDDAIRILRDHLEHDYWTTLPASLVDGPVGSFDDRVLAGALGTAWSHLARRIAVASSLSPGSISSLVLLENLVDDLGDAGVTLDGLTQAGGEALTVGACPATDAFCTMSSHTWRADWAESLGLFLSTPLNTSGVAFGDVEALLDRIARRMGPLWREAGVSPDRSPPMIAITGLQDGGFLTGDKVAFTVTVTDAFALGITDPIILQRADMSQSWMEGEDASITVTRNETDKTTHTLEVSIDSTQYIDGPLELLIKARDKAVPVNVAPLKWTLFAENSPAGSVSGTVHLGGRVKGALVSIYDATGGYPNILQSPLGSGMTDDAGGFSFELAEAPGVTELMAVVTNPVGEAASFVDIATGDTITLSQTESFEVFVTDYSEGDNVSMMITPLSIIGAAFARALWESPNWYDRDPQQWDNAIFDATNTWQRHFDDLGPPVALLEVRPANLADETEAGTLNAQVRYGALIAGLSQMAKAHAAQSQATSASMNTLTLTKKLVEDIGAYAVAGEPLFDGNDAGGVLAHGDVGLSSYTTRVELAQHMVLFLETNPFDKTTLVESDMFSLLEAISLDDSTRLYPASDPPIAYDTTPPGPLAFTSPTPAAGTIMRGQIDLRVTAEDNRKLTGFVWSGPASITNSSLDITGGFTGPWVLVGKLDLEALPDGQVEIKATATDEALNTSPVTRSLIVDKTNPMVTITSANDGGGVIAPGSWTGSATMASISGGVSDTNGAAAQYQWNGGGWQALTLSGSSFTLTSLALAGGTNTLEVRATDPAGNVGQASASYNRDATPPVVVNTVPQDVADVETEEGYTLAITAVPLAIVYGTVGAVPVKIQNSAAYTKWADRYTAAGPNLPEWRWQVSDNRTSATAIQTEYRILKGTTQLTAWAVLPAGSGTGYNRNLIVHSGLHATIGQASGDYTIEVRATDEYGNQSAPLVVGWTQTIKAPALRVIQASFVATGECVADKFSNYSLGNTSPCGGGTNNFATAVNGAFPGFRVAAWVVQNPNTIPTRVKLRSLTIGGSYQRGVIYSTPDKGIPAWTPAAACGIPGRAWDPVLKNGSCYSLPSPGRTESVAGLFFFSKQTGTEWRHNQANGNGAIAGTCAGCAADEYQIPAGGSLMVWGKTGPLSWIDSETANYENTSTWLDLDPVSGALDEEYRQCDKISGTPPNDFCSTFTIRQAVRHFTRVEVEWSPRASFQSRAGGAGAWVDAPGENTVGATGGSTPVATYETGYSAF